MISGNLDSNTMFQDNGIGNAVTVGSIPGWPTLPGWDLTTGFGTPALDAYASTTSTLSTQQTITVVLTAEQMSDVERGKKVILEIDAARSAGARARTF